MKGKVVKRQKKEPDAEVRLQVQVDKLKSENAKIQREKHTLNDKISKQEIQLERAALKFEKQEMAFAKQKNKLEDKIIKLQAENERLKKGIESTPGLMAMVVQAVKGGDDPEK